MYFDPPEPTRSNIKDEISYENVFKLLDTKNLACTPFSFGYS